MEPEEGRVLDGEGLQWGQCDRVHFLKWPFSPGELIYFAWRLLKISRDPWPPPGYWQPYLKQLPILSL